MIENQRNKLARDAIAARPRWYHSIELAPGIVTPGESHCREVLEALKLPESMADMCVLDIGAMEGFFTFECERRGGLVLATDYTDPEETGFLLAASVVKSRARHKVVSVSSLVPHKHGQFDLILFLGVLYHLPCPFSALRTVRNLCLPGAKVFIETQVIDDLLLKPDGKVAAFSQQVLTELAQVSLLQFFNGSILNPDDPSNFFAPNVTAMKWMLTDAGFKVESYDRILSNRAVFRCVAADYTPRRYLIEQAYTLHEP